MQERKYELHVHTAECDKFATNDIAKGGILTFQVIASPKDLITVLRSGNYRLIQNS
jgi:hypothetical protein